MWPRRGDEATGEATLRWSGHHYVAATAESRVIGVMFNG